MRAKFHLAGLAAVAVIAAGSAGATSPAWSCGTNPHDCGNGGGQTEAKPGCGYGDTRPHTGPPGIMRKGGFDQDQPANPGGPKECPAAAGK